MAVHSFRYPTSSIHYIVVSVLAARWRLPGGHVSITYRSSHTTLSFIEHSETSGEVQPSHVSINRCWYVDTFSWYVDTLSCYVDTFRWYVDKFSWYVDTFSWYVDTFSLYVDTFSW